MTDLESTLKEYETVIEEAEVGLENKGQLEEALTIYRDIEAKILTLELDHKDEGYGLAQNVLAYSLSRQSHVMRQLGYPDEAAALQKREVTAARESGYDVLFAVSLLFNATNSLIQGIVDDGLVLLEEAHLLFQGGNTIAHQRGLGNYWLLKADMFSKGLVSGGSEAAHAAASRAIELLVAVEHWPGVAQAYAERAEANEVLGNVEEAQADREAQARYQNMIS